MLGRLSALATIAMMLACGGDPAPLDVKKPKAERGSDEARAERKRKKAEERKREEQEEADAREREERRERMRKRDEGAQETSEPQEKRVAEKDEPAASDDPDEQERRERKERIRKREEEEARAEARLTRAEERKDKLEAEREAKLAKAEAKKAKKAKKKNVEEVDEADEEADDEEEPKAKKKNVEEVDEEVASDEETKSSPFKKKPKKQTAAEKKAAAKQAAAEKKAAEKAAAAEKLAEKKAAAEAKKQAAADAKKQAAEEKAAKKKAAEEVAEADEADEQPAEDETAKSEKRKATSKSDDKVDETEIEVDTASLPPPDPSEESNELDLTAGTPARVEEPVAVVAKVYAIDRRPLTLGRGKIDVHGGLVATAVTTTPAMGAATTASAQGLALGATYGIGAKGELGLDYTLGLHPGDAHGPFMFHGAYVAKQTEKLDIALSLGLAFDFVDSIDPGTMMATTRTAKALQVGIWARYHLGAKLSAFSGLPALPSSAGNLGGTAPLPPIPYQLSIGLSSVDAIALDLPAGLGYQATPRLYTFGVLDLAHLGMNNTTSAVLFSDFIPISLGGFYAASKMDVGAVFSDDLKQGADYLRFDVVVRYSIK